MTQYGYEPLSPEDSGSTLLARVNGVVPALLTNHKGAARPAYVQPGMLWIDDSGAAWLLNLFDGDSDVPIAIVDPLKHGLSVMGRHLVINGEAAEQERLEFQAAGIRKWSLLRDADDALAIINEMLGKTALSIDKATNKANFAEPPMIGGVSLASMLGGLKNVRLVTASGSVKPTTGATRWLGFLVGGGASGNSGSGTHAQSGGAGGAGCLFLASVSDATQYTLTVGGIGGNSSITIGGLTYSAAGNGGAAVNGLLNLSGAPSSDKSAWVNEQAGSFAVAGWGGDGPFGLGAAGCGAVIGGLVASKNGGAARGFGAGGGGSAGIIGGAGTGGAGTPGCLLILEF